MTIDEILEKLEGMKRSNENVDMWMFRHLLGPDTIRWRNFCTNAEWPLGGYRYSSPTGSFDTARMLLYQSMPGFCYRVGECCVSDDAWVIPDFNHPEHGARLQEIFPDECKRDPVEWMGSDVDQRPSGRPAIALCRSILLAWKKYQSVKTANLE